MDERVKQEEAESEWEPEEAESECEKHKGKVTIHMCPYKNCNKRFSRPSRLNTHILSHTGDRPIKCPVEGCGLTYTRQAHLKRHTLNAHSGVVKTENDTIRIKCQDCPRTFANKYSLDKHVRVAHGGCKKRYQCEECGQTFTKHNHLTSHQTEHSGQNHYGCPQCDKRFKYPRNLRHHLKSHDKYKCTECEEVLDNWTQLRSHRAKEHKTDDRNCCRECDKTFANKTLLKQHTKSHEDTRKVYHCPHAMCKRNYYHERNLVNHVKGYHEGQRFPCPFEGCEKRLASRLARKRHMKLFHEDEEKIKKKKKPPVTRKDKGKAKKAMAAVLCGLPFEPKTSKNIMTSEGKVEIHPEDIAKELGDDSEYLKETSDDEEVQVQTKQVDAVCEEPAVIITPLLVNNVVFSSDYETNESEDDKKDEAVAQEKKKFDFSKFVHG